MLCSAQKSRHELRKPCGTALTPFSRSNFESVESVSILSVGDGKIRPFPPDSGRASSSTSRAAELNGTRCSRPDFVRLGGSVQVAASRSISSHVHTPPNALSLLVLVDVDTLYTCPTSHCERFYFRNPRKPILTIRLSHLPTYVYFSPQNRGEYRHMIGLGYSSPS